MAMTKQAKWAIKTHLGIDHNLLIHEWKQAHIPHSSQYLTMLLTMNSTVLIKYSI